MENHISDNCSNTSVSAEKTIIACNNAIKRVTEWRAELKSVAIAEARSGWFGWFVRNKTDAQVWSGMGTFNTIEADISGYSTLNTAEDLKRLAERTTRDGGTTINISAGDYSTLARYWPE